MILGLLSCAELQKGNGKSANALSVLWNFYRSNREKSVRMVTSQREMTVKARAAHFAPLPPWKVVQAPLRPGPFTVFITNALSINHRLPLRPPAKIGIDLWGGSVPALTQEQKVMTQ